MSEFFIKRPNFAWVVALFISLAGLLVISKLPVAQYPNVAPPQITITATYPGASAKVLVDSVTSVLEESLNGAKGLLYFESTNNSNGTAEIVVTFEPGTDPDLAQVDVQNRLKKAEARMPQAVLTQGLQVEQTSAGFLLIYALSYKEGAQRSDTTALGDYAARNINNELRRLPGVGKLQFFSSEAAMRVWIDPQKLVGFGLSIDDVSNAIRGQNVQVPAGAFGSAPGSSAQELTATLAVKGTLDDPQEFGQVVLRANQDGSLVRLADVARLELGKESYNISGTQRGARCQDRQAGQPDYRDALVEAGIGTPRQSPRARASARLRAMPAPVRAMIAAPGLTALRPRAVVSRNPLPGGSTWQPISTRWPNRSRTKRVSCASSPRWRRTGRKTAASPPPTRRNRSAPARWVGRTAASVASSMPPRPGARTPATACRAIPGRRMPGGARRS